ncbi:MAG: 2,3-bisphosphoglycerate-independent phosphoglycerate mutase, partial [Patescibacteria group bacterium]|nr:2,3-bisphosphoglycerate-independent phosphoglycerate mutase [Patescibacteria group bacterium]
PPGPGNAIAKADTPFFDQLWAAFPHTQLKASGEAVGLPKGEVGTSEVGHLNIGAGRVVTQDVSKINHSIKNGSFFKNKVLVEACRRAENNDKRVHLIGLTSSGMVHASMEHLFALLKLCKQHGLEKNKVKIHFFSDGRDSPPKSAIKYLERLKEEMKKNEIGEIATVMGRYYAMDRDRRWERTKQAYRALTLGEGKKAESAKAAIESAYERGESDEFISPTVLRNGHNTIKNGDSVIFFNFRADRARQISKAFVLPEFKYFDRTVFLNNIYFVNLVECEKGIPVSDSAFVPHNIKNSLSQVIANKGIPQLHIAESEKYAYVTYYFNGGIEDAFPKEERIVIPSPSVSTYDKQPEMSALKIAKTIKDKFSEKSHGYGFLLVNLANPDMLGHTGIISAAIEGIEATDQVLKEIVNTIRSRGGVCIVTSDHGNAEEMLDPVIGRVSTSHSDNRVPFIVVAPPGDLQPRQLPSGILADVAPTVLKLMGIQKPGIMTGRTLI